MMFYICSGPDGVFACFTSFSKAKDLVSAAQAHSSDECTITACDIPINSESIRLILSGEGGYAKSTQIWSCSLNASSSAFNLFLPKGVST